MENTENNQFNESKPIFQLSHVETDIEFWEKMKNESEDRIKKMLSENSIDLNTIIGSESDIGSIDSYNHADKILSYIIDHSANANESTCGILSICQWLISHLQLRKSTNMCQKCSVNYLLDYDYNNMEISY